MKKSGLHLKLVIIMLLLIVSLMTAVCAFLVRGVVGFYLGEFYQNMQDVFSMQEFADALRAAADEDGGDAAMDDILYAYSGLLGIDGVNRNYYVLDGDNAAVMAGSDGAGELEVTPNVLTALNGREGYASNSSASYMDVALPISGEKGDYIVYIKDNKQTVHDLNMELFTIIMESLIVGLAISFLLSFLLSKTMIIPLQNLTRGANRVAEGDFSQKIEVHTKDEIGILTESFNDMARQLEDTLKAIAGERNKLSTVFLHMTDGVVAFDRDGVKIHYNPAAEQLLGVSLEAAELDYSLIFGTVEDRETVLALKSPTVIRAEREIKDKNLEIILAPFTGSETVQGGILALIHDVTQQRKSEQMHREFVANVSHELRTPITNIRSYAETLEDVGEEMAPEERGHFLQVILNESDRMVKIVQDLLMLSKFDAGDNDMRFENFDIANSVKNICEALRLNVEKRNMELSVELPDEAVVCCGDRARLEQVVVNVVTNAIRYTPDGGGISVKVGGGSSHVWVSVKDNGIGIPREKLPHIFDRFYRVDRARSRALGGSGLGLSIAREIVLKHGGEISIDSEPGKGTRVLIRVPREQNGGDANEP